MITEWAIRIYDPETGENIDFFSSFKGANQRQRDTVVVFEGIYGNGDYMVWKIDKDLYGLDLAGIRLELKLFLGASKNLPFWTRKYEIIEMIYNANEEKYTLYAITPSTAVLDTYLYEYDVNSLYYEEEQPAYVILKDVLEKHDIFKVNFYPYPNEEKLKDFKYKKLTLKREWTVRDFISYICDPNHYEWTVKHGVLFCGRELPAYKERRSLGSLERDSQDLCETTFFRKYMGDTKPIKVFGHINEKWRCIWAKHSAGRSGGISQACFVKIGSGTTTKEMYIQSLEDGIEVKESYKLQTHHSSSVSLGSILKDEGRNTINQISVEVSEDTLSTTDPYFMKFMKEGTFNSDKYTLRSYPYLDYKAGIQFPSLKLEDSEEEDYVNPHSILFNPDNQLEKSIMGGYIQKDKLEVPLKEKDDFRLRFPDGGGAYYQTSLGTQDLGRWLIDAPYGCWIRSGYITEYDQMPEFEGVHEGMVQISLYDSYFKVENSIGHFWFKDDGSFEVQPITAPDGQSTPKYSFWLNNTDGGLDIKSNVAGTINVNTQGGTINIGADASAVNLAGGGNKLAHFTHTHDVGNMGIKIPPPTNPLEGTQITEGD